MKSEMSSGITCVTDWDGVVRGMHRTLEALGTGDVIAFGSDNWGGTWFRCGDHGTPSDGWSVILPFVKAA